MAKGCVTRRDLRLHERSSWLSEWYEVSPGDTVTVERSTSDDLLAQTFTVPEGGLPDPPRSLDDKRLGQWQFDYLLQNALA